MPVTGPAPSRALPSQLLTLTATLACWDLQAHLTEQPMAAERGADGPALELKLQATAGGCGVSESGADPGCPQAPQSQHTHKFHHSHSHSCQYVKPVKHLLCAKNWAVDTGVTSLTAQTRILVSNTSSWSCGPSHFHLPSCCLPAPPGGYREDQSLANLKDGPDLATPHAGSGSWQASAAPSELVTI